MNIENSIEYQENKATNFLLPEIKEHLCYLDEVYNLCFTAQFKLNGKKKNEIGEKLIAQVMILMKITDFLRCMRVNVITGYPDQACTLASSIFELAHTAVYFNHNPEAAKKWFSIDSVNGKMPNLIGETNFRTLVESNYTNQGLKQFSSGEYKVYTQLCWMKHSHPKMQDLAVTGNGEFQFQVGPYTNEMSINHAWFGMEHAGRLSAMCLASIQFLEKYPDLQQKLSDLKEVRENLNQKAKDRFGENNPFL